MAFNARLLTFDWDSTTLVGVKSRGVTLSNELIDVTTDDANGWQTFLAEPGVKGVNIKLDIITNDEVLIAEFFNANATGETLKADLPSALGTPGNFSGTYMLQGLEYEGDADGELSMSADFVSSGAVTYTASSA